MWQQRWKNFNFAFNPKDKAWLDPKAFKSVPSFIASHKKDMKACWEAVKTDSKETESKVLDKKKRVKLRKKKSRASQSKGSELCIDYKRGHHCERPCQPLWVLASNLKVGVSAGACRSGFDHPSTGGNYFLRLHWPPLHSGQTFPESRTWWNMMDGSCM
jgi:hypothetical protein